MAAAPESFTVASSAEDLRQASRSGDVAQVTRILARYADDHPAHARFRPAVLGSKDAASGNTAAHLCSANGHAAVLDVLVARGAPVDAPNASGSTPLHYAALTGHLDVVRRLLAAGARPVVENRFARTALDEAVGGRHEHVAKFLLDYVAARSDGAAPGGADAAAAAAEDKLAPLEGGGDAHTRSAA